MYVCAVCICHCYYRNVCTYMGIVLTGGVRCSKCDTNSRESFRKLLLLGAMAEADGGAYFTISIWLNMYSRTIVCSAQSQQQRQLRRRRQQQPHIRARVWIMIISIILYGLVLVYDVLFVLVRVQSWLWMLCTTQSHTHSAQTFRFAFFLISFAAFPFLSLLGSHPRLIFVLYQFTIAFSCTFHACFALLLFPSSGFSIHSFFSLCSVAFTTQRIFHSLK